jgi:hypothetical protein
MVVLHSLLRRLWFRDSDRGRPFAADDSAPPLGFATRASLLRRSGQGSRCTQGRGQGSLETLEVGESYGRKQRSGDCCWGHLRPQRAPPFKESAELREVIEIEAQFLWLEPGYVGQNTAL